MARTRIRLSRERVRLASNSTTPTIDQALADPMLLGAGLGSPTSWQVWTAVLRATFGLPLSDEDRSLFDQVAGGREPPAHRVSELWCVLGRRSGKTRMAAAVCVHVATCEEHKLAAGETGFVLLLAASKSQAGAAFNYVVGFLEASPILRQQIETITADEVRLKGNIVIGVHSNSYRTIRSRTLLAVVGDETSFWRDDTSAAPDVETYRACIPALAATGGMFIGISTGYRKLGLLYQKWRDHFGQSSDDILVVQGGTEKFNPTLAPAIIGKAKAADPEAAESEWNGGFRSDIAAFLDDPIIDAAIDHARPLELSPQSDKTYFAFSDASGGRHDAFTVAIGHREGEDFICDVMRGVRPPFDPKNVVADFSKLLREYKIARVRADNYAAGWVETAWKAEGIAFDRSVIPASGLYLESLPLFMRGVVRIPDHSILIRELRLLERLASKVGKDKVTHPRAGSDDYANSLCGLLQMLTRKSKYRYDSSMNWVNGPNRDETEPTSHVNSRLATYLLTGGLHR